MSTPPLFPARFETEEDPTSKVSMQPLEICVCPPCAPVSLPAAIQTVPPSAPVPEDSPISRAYNDAELPGPSATVPVSSCKCPPRPPADLPVETQTVPEETCDAPDLIETQPLPLPMPPPPTPAEATTTEPLEDDESPEATRIIPPEPWVLHPALISVRPPSIDELAPP